MWRRDKIRVSHFLIFRIEFTTLAAEHKAVNLGQGFPDFSPAEHVKEALKKVAGDPNVMMYQYTRGFVSIYALLWNYFI